MKSGLQRLLLLCCFVFTVCVLSQARSTSSNCAGQRFEPCRHANTAFLAGQAAACPAPLPARSLQGLDASLVGVVPYAAIRLGTYDGLKALWRRSTGVLLQSGGSRWPLLRCCLSSTRIQCQCTWSAAPALSKCFQQLVAAFCPACS